MSGRVFSRISSWLAIVGIYVKSCLGINDVSKQQESITNVTLPTPQSNSDDFYENMDQCSSNFVRTVAENDTDDVYISGRINLTHILKDQLKEITQDNVKQISKMRKAIERNEIRYKETENRAEKHYKEMKEEFRFQHHETKRRLDRLEKKTNSR